MRKTRPFDNRFNNSLFNIFAGPIHKGLRDYMWLQRGW